MRNFRNEESRSLRWIVVRSGMVAAAGSMIFFVILRWSEEYSHALVAGVLSLLFFLIAWLVVFSVGYLLR